MPNWKKVIVSGSNAILLSIKVPSIHSNGSVSTGTNVVTIDSTGQLYMTGSYGTVPTLQSVTAIGSSTTIPITASILTSPVSNVYSATAGPLTVKGGNGVHVGGSNGGHLNLQGGDSTHATSGFGGNVVIRGGEGPISSGSVSITGDTTITGDTSVTGNITGSNIYATSDIFLGSANSFGIRLNNPSQAEFTIGPYTSATTKYLSVSDSFITIPSTGILLSSNTSLAQDNSGGPNSNAAVRFLGGASIAGNISTTSITASSDVDIQGVLSLPNISNVSESIRTAGRYETGDGTNSTKNKLGSACSNGTFSYVGGGEDNQANSNHSSVVGGDNNYVLFGACSSIVGGYSNLITKGSTGAGGLYGFIGGGVSNNSCAQYGVIGGGCSNHLDNNTCLSSVVGGQDNHIEKSCYSFIGGGQNNCIKETTSPNFHNVIGGGLSNLMRDNCWPDTPNCYAIIGGGRSNEINSSVYSYVGGGCGNQILDRGNYSTIVGGYGNKITDVNSNSFIGGGTNNCISGSTSSNSVIGGGCENVIGQNSLGSTHSVIAGGYGNCLKGQDYSGILGGKNNTSVGCNNDDIFIVGSDICVNKAGTTQNSTGCMTYVNDLCVWGTNGLNGVIRTGKLIQTSEDPIVIKKMESGDDTEIEVKDDLVIDNGKKLQTGEIVSFSPLTVGDTMLVTASINSGAFTHPAIIASGSEAIQATGSVGIQGVLSLPNIANVSASIAAAGSGNVSTSGTPANNQLSVFTNSNTIEGDSNLTYDSSAKLLSAPTASFDHLIVTQIISSSVINTSGSNIFGDEATDTQTLNGSVILNNLQNQASEATALMINGSKVVGTRELQANAFTNTSIPTAVTDLSDVSSAGSGQIITTAERTAIGTNSNKTSFPGFGTTSATALVGNTPLLQIGTTSGTALAGNTVASNIGGLAKSSNLSDLTNATTARTNLGVAIGTDVQAQSNVLTSLAENSAQTLGGAKTFSSAITASGAISASGTITGNSFVKGGGTSTQFLKADGSVDSSTYLTSVGTINLTSGVTGTLPVANGGTGATTFTAGRVLIGNGTSAFTTDSGFTYSNNKLGIDGTITSNTKDIISNASSATTLLIGDVNGNDSIQQLDFKAYGLTAMSITDSQVEITSDVGLKISNAPDTTTEDTALMITSVGDVKKRDLGSNAFNSTTIGTTTNTLTVDNTTLQLNTGTTFNGSGARTISAKTATVTEAGTGLATSAQIYSFVTGLGYGSGTVTSVTGTAPIASSGGTTPVISISAATTSAAGSMSAIDKGKIDAITVTSGVNLNTMNSSISSNTTAISGKAASGANTDITSIINSSLTTIGSNNTETTENYINFGAGKIALTQGSNLVVHAGADFRPGTTNSMNLGTSAYMWADTYSRQFISDASTISTPAFVIDKDSPTTGFYSSGNDQIGITISGSQIGYFNANGIQLNSGIGESNIGGHLQVHCLGVGTSPSTVSGEIRAAGDVTANYSSDKRLKKNIKPLSSALNKLLQISGVEFDWIEKEGVHSHKGHDVGVIAQEVEEVLPEVVVTRDNGYKAVNYEKIVPLLIEAIKDLKAEVDELKKSK